MATLELDITCRLREFALELSLAAGREVLALAGPSGAGKTTVLRCVAGLRRPDAGRIACDGETWFADGVADVPAERRSVGYVPQHHALFPHLTVEANVAFSGAGADEVAALLERLGLARLAKVRPDGLSGGERQRVALARALARKPRVLLLDEPLAALDAHTRRVVRDELATELRRTGVPTLLVTHDFTDAAALADRVAVIDRGTLRQLGPPGELVASPADAFVVAFTGGTVLHGEATGDAVRVEGGGVVRIAAPAEGRVALGVHPWDIEVRPGSASDGALPGTVEVAVVEGGRVRVRTERWVGEAASADGLEPGAPVHGVVRRATVLPTPSG
jgi:ABC-type sulfate/molybdate transport systems ATPase subunit